MRISMRADYGARAMMDLAEHYGKSRTQSADIAERQAVPESYLEQLLTSLRKAGLVRSVRGPTGGHDLARPPSEITLGDVLDVLEGVSSPVACMDDGPCSVSTACVLQDVWREVADSYQRAVHAITIEDLVRRHAERTSRSMYHI
ncbi:MAG: Rrf2 family transcriptional regulator [Chloroflexi bacterium]|nr:Rrf2 family transcriptional regulator [Chloroflexota bacterium]